MFSRLFNIGARRGSSSRGPITVSCARDPFDLRPALDKIQTEIERRRARGPLFILAGEHHDRPAHYLLRQGLIARLLHSVSPVPARNAPPSPRLAYGAEFASDHLGQTMKEIFRRSKWNFPTGFEKVINEADKDGLQFLSMASACQLSQHGPEAHRFLTKFLSTHRIPYRNNDMPMSFMGGAFDEMPGSNFLAAFVARSSDGIRRRNENITRAALNHQRETQADIYIQDCGRDHLVGDVDSHFEFRHSLTALFGNARANVLPIFITSPGEKRILPVGSSAAFSNAVVVEGLDTSEFYAGNAPEAEQAYCRRIDKHSGNELALPSLTNLESPVAAKAVIAWAKDLASKRTGAPRAHPF